MMREGQGIHMETRWTVHLCVPAIVLLLMAMGAFSAPAQTFEEAVAAHERGEYAAAYRGFRVHAEQGDASAQFNLGLMYVNGVRVPQDYAEAVKWYRKAADQGNATAQYDLGRMYIRGWGLPQDSVEATKWFRRAADQGNADAQGAIGSYYRYGFAGILRTRGGGEVVSPGCGAGRCLRSVQSWVHVLRRGGRPSELHSGAHVVESCRLPINGIREGLSPSDAGYPRRSRLPSDPGGSSLGPAVGAGVAAQNRVGSPRAASTGSR